MSKHSRKQFLRRAKMLTKEGKLIEAQKVYVRLCQQDPSDHKTWLAFSRLNRQLGLAQDANYCVTKAASILPDHPEVLLEYALVLHAIGKDSEAIDFYRRYLAQRPDDADGHYYLATAYLGGGKIIDAIKHYQQSISLQPNHFMALNNLSALMTNQGNITQALELLGKAGKLQPLSYQVLINQARAHLFSGDAEKSVDILETMIKAHPDNFDGWSKYLLCLNYVANLSPQDITDQHIVWAKSIENSTDRYESYNNTIAQDRKLRIGYVSPDFRNHSVAYFIRSILENHNKGSFTTYAYADCPKPDSTTAILKSHCDEWRWTHQMSSDEICESIRSDKIDILVDLAGHTGNNRLSVFARKPAPVQVSYLGYPNTTGLKEIDYRLTDSIADPTSNTAQYYSEELLRLPDSFLCYHPPSDFPDIQIEKPHSQGKIVFGSFNNLAKVTPLVIETWAKLLHAVDNSILLLKNKATSDSYTRTRLIDIFSKHGISDDQLLFENASADTATHLDMYNMVDIALDTFPYNGTTTTCEALWMGTPVITLYGNTHASRVSASILSQLELTDFIANNSDEYLQIATRLSNQPTILNELKQTIRSKITSSPLCDSTGFTRHLESIYSKMWCRYCHEHL